MKELGDLGLYQEVKSPVDAVGSEEGYLQPGCYRVDCETGEMAMEEMKESEFQPVVATSDSWYKVFLGLSS